MYRSAKKTLFIIYGLVVILFFGPCITYKPVPYFSDFSDTAKPETIKTVIFKNPTIQPNDILLVTIATLDNSLVSSVNATNTINAGAQPANGNVVNAQGMVELPFVGSIKVSGLTTAEAQDTIKAAAAKLFNAPVVSVRYASFKITILGEVRNPGSFTMPNEKVTLFDALGTAGDLTDFGKSNSILLIRDSSGENKQMVRLNINSKEIIHSPYYFLRPNDMLYVEPTSEKLINRTKTENAARNIGLISSSLALITTLIVLLARL